MPRKQEIERRKAKLRGEAPPVESSRKRRLGLIDSYYGGEEGAIAALQRSRGNLAGAARLLNVSRTTMQHYVNNHINVLNAMHEVLEVTGDYVEDKLMQAIDSGDVQATIFYCRTKLRSRGYTMTDNISNGPLLVQAPSPSTTELLEFLQKLSAGRVEEERGEVIELQALPLRTTAEEDA